MNPVVLLLAIVVGTVLSSETNWEAFKMKHEKTYPNEASHDKARAIFETNMKKIEKHNKQWKEGSIRYYLAPNIHSDRDPEEFSRTSKGYRHTRYEVSPIARRDAECTYVSPSGTTAPDSFTWQTVSNGNGLSMVSPVRNQQQCGDCWAFSATGAVESQVLINNISFVQLSPQQMTDCDTSDGGCQGGSYFTGWQYLIGSGGADSEAAYPFTSGPSGQTGTCHATPPVQVVTGCSFYNPANTDPASIKQLLVQYGPMSVGLCAGQWDMLYGGGLLPCPAYGTIPCPEKPQETKDQPTDHAVLLVGYGVEPNSGVPAWIIKNSWDSSWGLGGFGYLPIYSDTESDCTMTGSSIGFPTVV